MKRTFIVTLALTALALGACNESTVSDDVCTAENSFAYNNGTLCVVIEEGFLAVDCPDDLPEGDDFDDFSLCSDLPVDEAAEAEARRRGYGEPICEDGATRPAEDGCNTCTCSEGDWACTTLGCVETFDECLAGCSGCEDPAADGVGYVGESTEDCAVIDYLCDEGEVAFSNECGCGCKPAEAICEEGDTRMEDCNSCVCQDGDWVCDTQECPTDFAECIAECADCASPDDPEVTYVAESAEDCELIDYQCAPGQVGFGNECGCGCIGPEPVCEEGDTRTESCNECVCSEGQWACDDNDCTELELCLAVCDEECSEPADLLCAINGEYYCGDCELDCYGVTESETREVCDCTPPAGVRSEPMYFQLPEGCIDERAGAGGFEDVGEFLVAYSAEDLLGQIDCLEGTDLGFDFDGFVFIRAVFPESPDATIEGVYRDVAADTWTVNWTAPAYCGGPAPQGQVRYLMASFGDETGYSQTQCTYGICTEFFP